MSKGKRQRERAERRETKGTPTPVEESAKVVEEATRPRPPARVISSPQGYHWNGDYLVTGTGQQVAHASEFPQVHGLREHRRRMEVMRAFHKGEAPYFREDTNPKIVVPKGIVTP